MHDLYNLKEMLCNELADYGRDSGLSLSSLDTIDKLAHAAKNVAKLIEEKDESDSASCRRVYNKMGKVVSHANADIARKLREMMYDTEDVALRGEMRRLAEEMESM